MVTGDHSTPALLKGHSWHPVPVLLYSKWCRPDRVSEFAESACVLGGLGRFPATQIMPLAMANALKLTNSVLREIIMRVPLIAGNWKMNTTVSEAIALVNEMRPGLMR